PARNIPAVAITRQNVASLHKLVVAASIAAGIVARAGAGEQSVQRAFIVDSICIDIASFVDRPQPIPLSYVLPMEATETGPAQVSCPVSAAQGPHPDGC